MSPYGYLALFLWFVAWLLIFLGIAALARTQTTLGVLVIAVPGLFLGCLVRGLIDLGNDAWRLR